jgi:hypothetical protein
MEVEGGEGGGGGLYLLADDRVDDFAELIGRQVEG